MSNRVDYTAMGRRLRERRRALRLTQEKLAERVGISSSFIGHLERAEKIPSLMTVADLCSELDVSMDELVLGKHNTRCDRAECPLYMEIRRVLDDYRA